MSAPVAAAYPVQIIADAWYTKDQLIELLGLSGPAMDQARYRRELRFTKRAGQILFRGAWVESWLAGEPIEQRKPAGVDG
jgi:hypothetical protein